MTKRGNLILIIAAVLAIIFVACIEISRDAYFSPQPARVGGAVLQ